MPSPTTATLRSQLIDLAAMRPEKLCLFSPESQRAWAFSDFRHRTDEIARKLGGLGLHRGDKVAFLMDNGLFTSALLLGSMSGGFVAVPLNVRAGRSHLAYTLGHCDAKVVFASEEYRSLLEDLRGEIGRDLRIISADADRGPDWEAESVAEGALWEVAPDDDALLMYTSGSTGQPKGAVHTQRKVLAAAENSILAHSLTENDCSLCVLPLYHINAINVTLLPTLLTGGAVVMPQRFLVRSFWDWIGRYQCTWSALVPTIISQLIDWIDPRAEGMEEALRQIRFIRSSSAPLPPALHRAFEEKFRLPLIEAMGSTECGGNIFSNPPPPALDKIGTPGLPYGFQARIIGPDGADVPTGEPGEILLSGPGMMTGYYKNPEGTAAVLDSEGWLHTGDLAQRDEDGFFFIVGRSKELIIKGGMNIAPRQIDEALSGHPAVQDAVALGVPDPVFGEDIIAFAVLRSGFEVSERELLEHCESQVGLFKTPSQIFLVNDLPKGPSGKVQRLRMAECFHELISSRGVSARVPAERAPSKSAANGACGPLQEIISEMWAEVLEEEVSDKDANFFGLGGHSLLAIDALSRLRKRFGIDLSVNEFFTNPTVSGQAALVSERLFPAGQVPAQDRAGVEKWLLERKTGSAPDSIPHADPNRPAPLSEAQRRLRFLESLSPGLRAFNEPDAVRLRGNLDRQRLQDSFNAIIARHEILRTVFGTSEDGPLQIVRDTWHVEIEQIDLSALPSDRQTAELDRLLIDVPRRPFDLTAEPAVRAALIRLAADDHVFIVAIHHALCDGWSFGLLCRELEHFYRGPAEATLPAPALQYRDYAAWQRQQIADGKFDKELSFWKEYLEGAAASLDLPTKGPRPDVFTYRGEKRIYPLGRSITAELRSFSRQNEVSLFTVLTAAFNVLLSRHSGQEDIVLGIPLANRDRPEVISLFGFLIDFQALRTDLSGNPTFRELLARVRRGLLDVNANRAIPFNKVVEALRPKRDLSRAPMFQAMLIWKDRHVQFSSMDLPGLTASHVASHSGGVKYDLTVFLTEEAEELLIEIEYCTDLYSAETIARLAGHFQTLLSSIAADADVPVGTLPLLTEAERQQMLVAWNATEAAYPKDRCVHELIEEQAARTPDAVAVAFGNASLTYRELDRRANQLARRLQSSGIGRGTRVAICVDRSLEMVVGLLGILKAGAAYIPLDPDYPRDRLAFVMEDAEVRVLVAKQPLIESLRDCRAKIIDINAEGSNLDRVENSMPDRHAGAEDLAYVIYTSGSTGRPKGVEISHRALANFLESMRKEPGCRAADTVLAITTLSFDIAGLELWLPLTTGARVVLASRETARDGRELGKLLTDSRATLMQATPATWQLLLSSGWKGKPDLTILCGGEAWSDDLARQLLPRCSRLWNVYGPTETTIWSALGEVKPDQPVLIEKPIANTQLYVLDRGMQPVPIGVPGELFIGGDGLARGYLNRPELTRERFVPNPFVRDPGSRMYRTGDLVQRRPDGMIQFLGRMDHQVKVRGFRIELGEIEAVLRMHSGVQSCVVAARPDASGESRLAAYVVSRNGPLPVPVLREHLRSKLPEYMVPAAFVALEQLPLTPNGKVDRKALPAPEAKGSGNTEDCIAPRTPTEKKLAGIWQELLGVDCVGLRDNFYDLGGHSLLTIRLQSRIQDSFGILLPIAELFRHPNIEGIARVLESTSRESGSEAGSSVPHSRENDWAVLSVVKATGSKPPLIQVNVAYNAVVHHLSEDRPFYVLNTATALDERIPPYHPAVSVGDIADRFLAALQAVQPSGPYYLIGHCFSGLIVYEMAQRLLDQGERVAFLGIIDWFPRRRQIAERWSKFSSHGLLAKIKLSQKYFMHSIFGLVRARHHSLKCAIRRFLKMPLSTEMLNWRRRKAAQRLASLYTVRKYPGRVTVFHSVHAPDEEVSFWAEFASEVETFEVPGEHETMMLEPNVGYLAKALESSLNRVQMQHIPSEMRTESVDRAEEALVESCV